MDRYSYSK